MNRSCLVVRCLLASCLAIAACSEHSTANSSAVTPSTTVPVVQGRVDDVAPPVEHYDPSAQIEQLKELRQKGLITEDEFQQKKKHLLERQ